MSADGPIKPPPWRSMVGAAIGVALLVFVAIGDPRTHVIAAFGGWIAVRWLLPRAARRPQFWLVSLVVLGVLGALLGHRDATWIVRGTEYGYSREGALAAGTMVGRGLGIAFLTAGLMGLVSRDRLLGRLASTPLAHFAEVVVVAIGIVPELSRHLAEERAILRRERRRFAVRSLFERSVSIIEATSRLATDAAVEIARRRGEKRGAPKPD